MNTLRMAVPFPRPGGHDHVTPPPSPPRAISRALAAAVALLVLAAPAAAETPERGDFDARPAGRAPPGASQRRGAARAARDVRRSSARSSAPATRARRGRARRVPHPAQRPRAAARSRSTTCATTRSVFGLDRDDVAALTPRRPHAHRRRRSTCAGSSATAASRRPTPSCDAAVTGAGRLLSVTGPAAPDLAVARSCRPVERRAGVRRGAPLRPRRAPARSPCASAPAAPSARPRSPTAAPRRSCSTRTATARGSRWRVLAPVARTEVYDATVDAARGAVVRRANRVRLRRRR